jgi:hypothetical protein
MRKVRSRGSAKTYLKNDVVVPIVSRSQNVLNISSFGPAAGFSGFFRGGRRSGRGCDNNKFSRKLLGIYGAA